MMMVQFFLGLVAGACCGAAAAVYTIGQIYRDEKRMRPLEYSIGALGLACTVVAAVLAR